MLRYLEAYCTGKAWTLSLEVGGNQVVESCQQGGAGLGLAADE